MFVLPDSLTALSAANLDALSAEARAEFADLRKIDPADLTDEQVTQMETLASAVTALRAEGESRTTAAADRVARAAAAASAVETAATTTDVTASDASTEDGDSDAEDADSADGDADADAESTDADADADSTTETDGDSAGDTTDGVQASANTKGAPVANKGSLVRQVRKTPVPQPEGDSARPFSITAAADVPGLSAGQSLESMRDIAEAFASRTKSFPSARVEGMYKRSGVAIIRREFEDGLVASGGNDQEVVDRAGTEQRLPGGSLVAAGGWCAPSETFYDLCVTESLDGLIDLPEVSVSRGGMRFTKGPSFADIYADAGFFQTEAQAIAGTEKPCIEVDCPPFEEIRLDVSGVCVTAPILTNAGYPELVQRWIEGTLVAQAHKESAEVINRMITIAGAVQAIGGDAGVGFDLMTALEWGATSQKYRWRMPINSTLEAVLPFWARPIVRADLALRNGKPDLDVSDAEIDSYFAQRGIRVQWVYDWQALVQTTDALGCNAAIPATLEFLLYPAGTFVKGVADVISLDAIYDSTNIRTNMYTAVFAESGFLVANRCYDACRYSVPTAILGATGLQLAGAWTK